MTVAVWDKFLLVADNQRIDPEFTAYPLRELAAAALQRAADLGAEHADFRAERIRGQQIGLSDGSLETLFDADDLGLAVRVVLDGTWGFAAAVDLTQAAAVRAAQEAVDGGQGGRRRSTPSGSSWPTSPAYGDVSWVSSYQVDPFDDQRRRQGGPAVRAGAPACSARTGSTTWTLRCYQVRECKFYSDGVTTALQQRVRLHPVVTAVAVDPGGRFETMRTLAPPAGPGLEYLTGTARVAMLGLPGRAGRRLPELLAEKLAAPSVRAGRYDLVIDPSQPVADHPRVDRARDRAGPGARLRGRLRRAPPSRPSTSSAACSTARP